MEYFIFNNINSMDMKIVIKSMPPITRAKQRINTIALEGRSGSLHEIEENFDSYNMQIECILMPGANIDDIKKWLIGNAQLILSTNPNVSYMATIVNKIDFSKYLTYLREFPLELEVEPISYGLEEKSIEIDANSEKTFNVKGNYKTFPIIKIKGNGSISCNGKTFIINENDGELNIDCELLNAYDNQENKNECINGLEDPLFLQPGDNIINTIGVTAVITYREAWL